MKEGSTRGDGSVSGVNKIPPVNTCFQADKSRVCVMGGSYICVHIWAKVQEM